MNYAFQVVDCRICEGTGKYQYWHPCPNQDKAMRGKHCPHCGSTTKYGHRHIIDDYISDCKSCRGTGKVQEDICSRVPKELLNTIPIKVYRDGHETTWNEAYLGYNLVLSVVDYGRSSKMTDEEFIKDAREHMSYVQYTNIGVEIDQDSIELCDHLGIFVGTLGYNVKKVMT